MTYKVYPLRELIDIKHGFAFPGNFFSEDLSFPTLVTPGNFKVGGGFLEAKPKTYSGELLGEYILQPGDLIVTMTDLSKAGDSLGYSAVVPHGRTYLHNQRIGKIVNKRPELLSLKYLNWFMRTKNYRKSVIESATGTTVRHTSPSRILDIEINLPSYIVQLTIAAILDSIDSKIEINKDLSKTLEGIAQTIFKAWFIDFDPVKSKLKGENPAGMDTVTAALFPDSMEESELGLIPKNWKIVTLENIAQISKRGVNPQSNAFTEFSHYSIPAFDSGMYPTCVLGKKILSGKFVVDKPSVLVSKLNPETQRIWTVPKPHKNAICSTEFIVLNSKSEESFSFIDQVVKSSRFQETFVGMATGSTGSRQRVKPVEILQVPIVVADDQILRAYSAICSQMIQEIDLIKEQNQTLVNLQNVLLPRLISGEIQIPHGMLVP